MISIAFTTDNIISLTRLETTFRKEYGQRFNLSDSNSLLGLLKLAADSSSQSVKAAFHHFFDGLKEEDRQQLIYRGVKMNKNTASALSDTPISKSTSSKENTKRKLPEGVIKVVYRGQTIYKKNDQVIDDPFSITDTTPAQPPSQSSAQTTAPLKKPAKRIYRGKVIED